MSDELHPLLSGLNEPQREAVVHTEGPLLVLAGPGSGKTRVITHRIAWMLQHGIRPYQIVALTFTNKAADEMKKRLEILAPDKPVRIGTFHKFCAYLLRLYASMVGMESNFTIYDTDESKKLLGLILEKVPLPTGITPDRIAAGISWAKNELVLPDEYISRTGSLIGSFVEKVYPQYQKLLKQGNAVDFDDLLFHVAILLKENPEIRRELDARFRYILVDEYQDTNLAQYAIARALSIDHPNLAVTGDPDQSIYGWRGANIQNILNFEKDFKDVKTIRLEQNYRSTKRILAAADKVIAYNEFRKEKHLFTDNEIGRPVRLLCCFDQREEAEAIADEIAAEIKEGKRRPKDYAIFFRVNALSRNLEHALHRSGVSFQLVRGLEFFNRKEIKDVLAYLQLIYNSRDTVSFMRIVNEPRRGIGKTTIGKIVGMSQQYGISTMDAAREFVKASKIAGVSAKVKKALAEFVKMIDRLCEEAAKDEYPIETLVADLLAATKYKEQYSEDDEEDRQRLENIDEFLSEAREFDKLPLEEGENALEKFLEQTALVSDVDSWETDSDRVSLMTLHAAKGLEFPVVYLIALEENLLPHERSTDDQKQLEEERRLFFVGMTRAKEELRLSRTHQREFRGRTTASIFSRFIVELPREEMILCDSPEQLADCPDDRPFDGTKAQRLVVSKPQGSRWNPNPEIAEFAEYFGEAPAGEDYETEIDYDESDVEYDEDGNAVPAGSKAKKKKRMTYSLSLTTAAELLKRRQEEE